MTISKKREKVIRKPAVRALRFLLGILLAVALVVGILAAAQAFAHRKGYFTPGYPRADLTGLLEQPVLSDADYNTLLFQTGLGRPAIDGYRTRGAAGTWLILDTQAAFFRPPAVRCDSLGFFTREDHQIDGDENLIYGFPVAPLEKGDVLLSFSTHTVGWRHGHAGLVVETRADSNATLEAALIGTDSVIADAGHWGVYATFLHLRLKEITPEQQEEIAAFALDQLNGVPYHLTSGVFGRSKAPAPDSAGFGAQCAYLVWYGLQAAGFDADGDGGRIVTVADLAQSPLFEVVQIYGMDPGNLTYWEN